MDPKQRMILQQDVEIIINSAASVDMGGSIHEMLQIDLFGVKRMLNFAHTCTKLIVFSHVSTAYVNSNKAPFSVIEEKIYPNSGKEDFEVQIARILESDPKEQE